MFFKTRLSVCLLSPLVATPIPRLGDLKPQFRHHCVMRTREIYPETLLHSCSRHLSGLWCFELRLSTIAVKTGGYPRTVPSIKEVAEESQTHTRTHTHHMGCLDAELRKGLLQEETSKNHRPTCAQIHLLNHHIPLNLPNRAKPNFTDLFLSFHYIQPRV